MATTEKNVVIDGCAVPFDLYRRIRLQAIQTRQVQFIGVIYDQPAELRRGPDEKSLDWDLAMHRHTMMRAHLMAGEHLTYVIGQDHDTLAMRRDVLMILWITPRAESMA
jgi:hypothetical protein